eukprot:PhM_4_TR225/c0_g2_i1/m.100129
MTSVTMKFADAFESYTFQQKTLWPVAGRHIVAHFDETSVVVYQAYNATIAQKAATHQAFDIDNPSYNPTRMTWFKPNFLWMMYRSGWASKPNQEHILAVRLRREWFEHVLLGCALSTTGNTKTSPAVVQWDPDHTPCGGKTERRALQVGIRSRFASDWARGVHGPAILERA